MAASRISDLCRMSRVDYEAELLPEDSLGNMPASFQARSANEKQGKTMKFYQLQRYKLEKGSHELQSFLKEADECMVQLEEHSEQASSIHEKKPRLL